MSKIKKPKNLIIDVDGVLTDGSYYYTKDGKVMKRFGPDDNDALTLLHDHLYIHAVSGDKRGFQITKKRVLDDMKIPLDLVNTHRRIEWIKERFNLSETIYMGDGIFDSLVFKHVFYSIAPANAFIQTRKFASHVTSARGGEGAVAEAVVHILETFFSKKFELSLANLSKRSGKLKE